MDPKQPEDPQARRAAARALRDAEIASWESRAAEAQAKAAHAYERLLTLAESHDSGQIPRVARFLGATFNGQAFAFDLFDLRSLDVQIGDDMLACLDALRWGRADLYKLVPDGEARVLAILERWGLKWPQSR